MIKKTGSVDNDRHLAALDGVRGFAAFSVVLFHIGQWFNAPFASNSGLAVDLFFLLSGYVLTLAYADRLDTDISAFRFMVIRLFRLMPLVILGTIISAVYTIIRVYIKHEELGISNISTAAFLGLFNLPYLTAPHSLGGGQVFPLNGPQYSLFFEIAINAIWASLALFRLKLLAGIISLVCFAIIIHIGILGGDTPSTFAAGFPRVTASFFAGVVIFHFSRTVAYWRWWPRIFLSCIIVTIFIFYSSKLSFFGEIVWVITVSPLLVLSGACTELKGRFRSLALASGRLSYPVYVLHYPIFTWVNGVYQTLVQSRDILIEGILSVAIITFSSFFILKFYDEPIRHRLNKYLKLRKKSD